MAKKKSSSSSQFHNLHNLLTTVDLSAQVLLQELDGTLNAQQKKHVKTILSETKKIEKSLKKLKTY